MIPFAILSGTLFSRDASPLEIRILELSVEGFTFRLAIADTIHVKMLVDLPLLNVSKPAT